VRAPIGCASKRTYRRDLKLGLGSLALRVGGNADNFIDFDSFDPANALGQKPFESIELDDGGTLSYADLLAQGFDLIGTAGNDVIRRRDAPANEDPRRLRA